VFPTDKPQVIQVLLLSYTLHPTPEPLNPQPSKRKVAGFEEEMSSEELQDPWQP